MNVKRKNMARLCSFVIAVVLMLSLSTTAFAAAPESTQTTNVNTVSNINEVQPRGTLSGYGQCTLTSSSDYQTFTVHVDGNYSTAAGMTIKTSGNYDAFGYITIYKPNGDVYKPQLFFSGGQEEFYQLYFVNGGDYKVVVDFFVPSGTVNVQCWIYA